MRIYTKTGDNGTTSLVGGRRISKTHPRVEAYGTIDELISYIGLLRDLEIDQADAINLIEIQDKLMVCATALASEVEGIDQKLPVLKAEDILKLEHEIDEMEKILEPLTSFILPGGHTAVSFCHIARNVCRRAERDVLKISDKLPNNEMVNKYMNRLSDYLFVLSRKIANDLDVDETAWDPVV